MTRLTVLLSATALATTLAGVAPADENPVSRIFDRAEREISESIETARESGWRNEVRSAGDDDDGDRDDRGYDDDDRDDRNDRDDDDDDRGGDDDGGDDDDD